MASCSYHSAFDDSDSTDIENRLIPEGNFRVNEYESFVAETQGESQGESVNNVERAEPTRALATQRTVTCSCKSKCSQKKNRRTAVCPCKNADLKCSAACGCGKGRLKCQNGKVESIERENAQNLPQSAFDRHREEVSQSFEEIKKFISELTPQKKDGLLVELLTKGKGSLDHAKNLVSEEYDPEPSIADIEAPDWCICGHCVSMQNPEEQKCCKLRNCITSYKLYENLCLDRNVLETAIKARCDIRADELDFSMTSYRKASYRQYILWRYGRLGKGNRKVCPSCTVRMVRDTYPAPDGNYMGFRSC